MGIIAKNIGKVLGEPPTRVLKDISLEIKDGEFVALTGKSGSGKSTLLYLLSSLDNASEGSILVEGKDITEIENEQLHQFRNQEVGFIFQFHYLLPELSALENVLMPARKYKQEKQLTEYAIQLLEQFGLKDKLHRLPRQLSGGEQQRVAIARALVMKPKYLFADEPTGALDTANGERVLEILKDCNENLKTTIIMVTHDPDFAAEAKRQIHLRDGQVVEEN